MARARRKSFSRMERASDKQIGAQNEKSSVELHPDINQCIHRFLLETEQILKDNDVPGIEQRRVFDEIQNLTDVLKTLNPNQRAPYSKRSKIKAEIAGIADYLYFLLSKENLPDSHFEPLEKLNYVMGESMSDIVQAVKRNRSNY